MDIVVPLPKPENSFYVDTMGSNYVLDKQLIFVYGSNSAGRHGLGAAKDAVNFYGARYGIGEGRQGRSYGIPTKDHRIQTLPLSEIAKNISRFLLYVREHEQEYFFVTALGTGLAKYKHEQIAPMFKGAQRCWFPLSWKTFIKES